MVTGRFLALALIPLASTAQAVTLSGRVVDSQGQQSYANALVSGGATAAVHSDGQGFFRLDRVAAGPLLLAVELPDGEVFHVRLQIPARAAYFVELDRARHVAPTDDDDY